jgi:hypothetical protein
VDVPRISSCRGFLAPSESSLWRNKVVFLFDDFKLHSASDQIRKEFLEGLIDFKTSRLRYVVSSVIAAETFNILHLNPKDRNVSPFNIADTMRKPVNSSASLLRITSLSSTISSSGLYGSTQLNMPVMGTIPTPSYSLSFAMRKGKTQSGFCSVRVEGCEGGIILTLLTSTHLSTSEILSCHSYFICVI